MPPNRKAHFEATHSIASLKVSHGLAAKAPRETKAPPSPVINSDLYWDWPADKPDTDEQAKKQEPPVLLLGIPNKDDHPNKVLDDIFSAHHIVANLIKAAQQLSENKQLKAAQQVPAVVGVSDLAQPNSEEYWFQPFKHLKIEDVDDRLTSVHNIEAHLIRQAEGAALRHHGNGTEQDGTTTKSYALDNPESVAYWDWPAWSEKYHEALFSAKHVQAGLLLQAEQLSSPNSNSARSRAAATIAAASDYWAF